MKQYAIHEVALQKRNGIIYKQEHEQKYYGITVCMYRACLSVLSSYTDGNNHIDDDNSNNGDNNTNNNIQATTQAAAAAECFQYLLTIAVCSLLPPARVHERVQQPIKQFTFLHLDFVWM